MITSRYKKCLTYLLTYLHTYILSYLLKEPDLVTFVDRSLTLAELESSILFADFHLERVVVTDEGSKSSEALSTAAADTDQQHVATRLPNHSHDSRH